MTKRNVYAEALFRGTENAVLLMEQAGVIPDSECPEVAELEGIVAQLIDGGLLQTFVDSGVQLIYVYNEETRDRILELNDSDGYCLWTCDNENFCVIGICRAAFAYGRDYVILCLLHELCHGLLRRGDYDHNDVFMNLLDDVLMRVNAHFGLNLQNDYAGMNPEDAPKISLLSTHFDSVDRTLEAIRKRHYKRRRS